MSNTDQITHNVRHMKALFDAIQLLDSQDLEPSDKTFTALAAHGFDLACDTEKALND